jgi:hypothetical protein
VKLPLLLVLLMAALLPGACTGQQITEPMAEITVPVESGTAPPATKTPGLLPAETSTPQSRTPTKFPAPAATEESADIAPAETPANPDPTATTEPTVQAEEQTVQVISGQTAEGAYFYGNPDAPVTLLDYSDFL